MRELCPAKISRRTFVGTSLLATLGGASGCAWLSSTDSSKTKLSADASQQQAWAMAAEIRRQTLVPQFPDQQFNVRDYGAVDDGTTDCSNAFAAAINACEVAGGGRVVVPSGRYLSGPIHLKSNTNLHLEAGSTIAFLTDPQHYLPAVLTRWEGVELMGYSPLIYAFQQKNIAVTGSGTLDGQANRTTWWPWKGGVWGAKRTDGSDFPTQDAGRAKLFADADKGVPPEHRLYAEGAFLRPPFFQPYECENVLIEGVTITNAPFWQVNPVRCHSVTVRGVTCASLGPNSDGCDPESCRNVVIEDCFFDTGDDCIAIKSGRNTDGRRLDLPSENIVIANCKMRNGHGGVVIGSEISGGARNIFVENCEMSSPHLERGIRIKTNSVRGGTIENIYVRNIDIGEVQTALVIDFYYEEGDAGTFDPNVHNIELRNFHCKKATHVFQVRGFARAPIRDLRIINASFANIDEIGIIEHVEDFVAKNVTIQGKAFHV